MIINQSGYWFFPENTFNAIAEKNGWVVSEATVISPREIADLKYAGQVSEAQPEIHRPRAQ